MGPEVIATLHEPWQSVQDWALFIGAIFGTLGVLYAGGAHLVARLERTFDQVLDEKLDEKLDEVRAQLARNGGSTVADATHEIRRDVKALAAQLTEMDVRITQIESTLSKGQSHDE